MQVKIWFQNHRYKCRQRYKQNSNTAEREFDVDQGLSQVYTKSYQDLAGLARHYHHTYPTLPWGVHTFPGRILQDTRTSRGIFTTIPVNTHYRVCPHPLQNYNILYNSTVNSLTTQYENAILFCQIQEVLSNFKVRSCIN